MDQIPPEAPYDPAVDSPKEETAADTLEGTHFPRTPLIPQNREAEEAVVGAVLINPEVYYDLAQFLQPDDFYIVRHRWIWEAFTTPA